MVRCSASVSMLSLGATPQTSLSNVSMRPRCGEGPLFLGFAPSDHTRDLILITVALKVGIANKRLAVAWNKAYLCRVVGLMPKPILIKMQLAYPSG